MIRLTHIDGKLPNLALMKLARHHRDRGDEVRLTRSVRRDMMEPAYDRVYGSAIFSFSAPRVAELRQQFPGAIVGGTHDLSDNTTVESFLGDEDLPSGGNRLEADQYDYSIYPKFDASIGFTQRGCRLKCGFCVVPRKEGKPRSVNTIASIWRGGDHPRHLHLLDNDFFGQPRAEWEARVDEIRAGGFKVCLNQGINIRMIDDDSARALASIPYYDDSFKVRRLYTAWDNLGDEARFFRGVDALERAGVPPRNLLVYMLIGYDPRETWEKVMHRFNKMWERKIRPYPMVYGDRNRTLPLGGYNKPVERFSLQQFQRWAVTRLYEYVDLEDYDPKTIKNWRTGQLDLLAEAAG